MSKKDPTFRIAELQDELDAARREIEKLSENGQLSRIAEALESISHNIADLTMVIRNRS